MRRSSKLAALAVMTTALVLPLSTVAVAATTVNYKIAGVEYATTTFPAQSSLAGAGVSTTKDEFGHWNAVVQHDLGGIVGGTFSFTSRLHNLTDSIVQGTFGPAVGTCAKSTIAIHAVLGGGGSFDVTLTRYGSMRTGSCVVYLAIARGSASLTFP